MSKKQEKETKEKKVSKVAKTKKTKSATKKTKEISKEVVESSVVEEVVESPVAEEVVESPVAEQKPEEFNWDSITKNEIYSDKERAKLISTYSETLPVVESKQVIDGVVVAISDREVIVDINFKSDGVISSSEFKYNEDLKIGDTVEVLVEKQEDKNGQLIHLKTFKNTIISIDTFRSEVAKKALDNGALIVNDVSGGDLDSNM